MGSIEKMSTLPSLTEEWVLEHACFHGAFSVIKEIQAKSSQWSHLVKKYGTHLLLSTLMHIVDRKDVLQYELAIEILNFLLCDAQLVSSHKRTLTKITYSLKTLVMLNKVMDKSKDVVVKLNKYFPKPREDERDKIAEQVKSFRRLILQLFAHKKSRQTYFGKTFFTDYGEAFHFELSQLTATAVNSMFLQLKTPVLDLIVSSGKTSAIYQDLSNCRVPLIQYLIEMLFNSPEVDDFLEFINMIHPSPTITRVNPLDFCSDTSHSPQEIFVSSPITVQHEDEDNESFATCRTRESSQSIAEKIKKPMRSPDPLFSEDDSPSFVEGSEPDDRSVPHVPNLSVHLTRSKQRSISQAPNQ